MDRAASDMMIKPAWAAFLDAGEVLDAVSAYDALRRACRVPDGAFGRPAFDAVLEATLVSQVPHKTKSLMTALGDNWKLRPIAHATTRVLISGAGPTGLRAAVEAALMGMRVHVIEKRSEFSRVNILMLWQNTVDDLIAYGARTFYPKFTNRRVGTSPLHLGTREIQLVLLKNALLLGVTFSYGTELVALQAPPPPGAAGEARQRDEEMEIKKAQLEAYEKALEELAIKAETQRGFVAANQAKKAEWADKVARYQGGMAAPVPVLPVGDTLLEPFWPQGLGSNRGFHSALDAVWAVHVMETDGLEAALLERNFWYDLMLQGPWQPGMLLKQANGWSADPVTRYADGAILRTKSNYTNPQSRRLFRGAGATPARIAALDIRAERGADGTNIFR